MKTLCYSKWTIDGTIDLAAACRKSDWHLATTIDALQAQGLSREDAEAFANFAFCDHAGLNGGRTDGRAEDRVTDAQWDRLSVK